MKKRLMFAAVSAAAMLGSPLVSANEELNFDAYREMLADGNPAELFEMEGEELWRTARGRRTPRSSSATSASGRVSWKAPLRSCRATSRTPARCRTSSRAC